ncbi:MAG: hypothetical protein JWR07_5124 [Nevskia sp.]|nr:hypothetical protein [Nevskia sp.]
MQRTLDFKPHIATWTPTFECLAEPIERLLRQFLPATLERLNGTLTFAHKLSLAQPSEHEAARLYFRASLAEYVSIEDVATQEGDRQFSKFSVRGNQWPLPHIFRLLRHLNVHVQSNTLSDRQVALQLKNLPNAQPVNCSLWYVEGLTASHLLQLDGFNKGKIPEYRPVDAEKMVEWLEAAQHPYGITDLIWRAVVEAGDDLCRFYKLQTFSS